MSAEARIIELGLAIPPAPAAAGLYVPCVESGNLLFVSGQFPTVDGKPAARGKLGAGIGVEQGADLARICTLNALAIVRGHLGTLDRVSRVVRVGAFVASAPNFTEQPEVANGASQLLIDIFGEPGKHARAAVGMAELPRGVPVEVEFVFEVRPAAPVSKAWAAAAGRDAEEKRSRGNDKGRGKTKKKNKKK
jgi:enamine deaminase RidA (YjgF/YER057c/UK114 family)